MKFIIRLLVNGLAVLITSFLLSSHVHVDSMLTAIIVAAVLSLLNYFIRPLLILLTIPVTIFSFGLFLLVINAVIILITSRIVKGFTVDGFWWAMLFSIVLSIINSFFEASSGVNKKEPGE